MTYSIDEWKTAEGGYFCPNGYVFDDDAGVSKPSAGFFASVRSAAELAKGSQVLPEHVLHVGDDPRCDGGAEAYGMEFLRVYDVEDFPGKLSKRLEQERSKS